MMQLRVICEAGEESHRRSSQESLKMTAVVDKYLKENEKLIFDKHRINEKLRLHWRALRDVKILATRLRIMP
jgi:hypothetical protein